MADFATLMGLAGGAPGGGGPFVVLATANANLTVPDGVRLGFISVRSDTGIVTVTLPAISGGIGCGLLFSCPDGAANNVTIAPRAGNTVLGGASLIVAGDNLIMLVGVPGATNWEGHVGT